MRIGEVAPWVAVLLVSVAAASFVATQPRPAVDPPPSSTSSPSPSAAMDGPRIPLELKRCSYVEILVRVPAGNLRGKVPSDFELQAPVDGTASILLGGANCSEAASGNDSGPASFAWTSAIIQAPVDAHLQGPNVSVYLYRLEHMVVDDLYRGVADGARAERLNLTRIEARVAPAGSSLFLQGTNFEHRVTTVPSPEQPGEASGGIRWREFGRVAGGYAILEALLVPDAGSGTIAGVVQPQAGSTAGAALGTTNAGTVSYGTDYSVLEGFMQYLAHPRSA